MSIRVMSAIWERSDHDGSELLLLLALADFADDDGYCWPGVARLAHKTRMHERTVQKCLKELVDSGELLIEHGGGRNKTNRYQLVLPNGNGGVSNRNGGRNDTKRVATSPPESSIEPSKEIEQATDNALAALTRVPGYKPMMSDRNGIRALVEEFPDVDLLEVVTAYAEYLGKQGWRKLYPVTALRDRCLFARAARQHDASKGSVPKSLLGPRPFDPAELEEERKKWVLD